MVIGLFAASLRQRSEELVMGGKAKVVAVGVVAGLVLLSGCGLGGAAPSGGVGGTEPVVPSVAVDGAGAAAPVAAGAALAGEPEVAQVVDVLEFIYPVRELTADPATGDLWVLSLDPAGQAGEAKLWRVDGASGATESFGLPETVAKGFTSGHVRVGQDGAVWVSLSREVARIDPVTSTVTSVSLPLEAEDALPGAYDTGADLPGTWISAILPDGDGALIARNNVPYLTRLGPDLSVTRGAAVDEAHAGAADLAHEVA